MDGRIASEVIKENAIAYAKQILANIFPNAIDGFKKVKRRILFTQPIDKRFGGQMLVSNTIKIHPYSDASIYDAGCRMVDRFRCSFPLLEIRGKGGSYSGDKAAHSRYTEFWLSDFCKAILFDGINFKTIPTELTEDLKGNEIKYFIPKIPTSLIYSNESIGFGYSSFTVPLKFENVCNIVIDFVSCKDKTNWDYSKIIHLFLPLFSINVWIKNKKELINAYRKGNFEYPIETEGTYKIINNNTVLVRTLAYGVSPNMINKRIIDHLKNKASWLNKTECDFLALSEDDNYVDFQISVKRGVNLLETIEHLKKIMLIRTSVHPSNNYVFEEKKFRLDPPELIMMWYKERYRSIFSSKKHKQQDLQTLKLRLNTYLVVCEHTDEVIDIVRNSPSDEVVVKLKSRFELSQRQCEILLASDIQLLMRSKRKELEERIEKVVKDLDDLNESFRNIDDEIINDINQLKKRFKTDTTFSSKESSFIGCLLIGDNGIIQISSTEELLEIGKMFQSSILRYIKYPKHVTNIALSKSSTSTCFKSIQALPYTTDDTGILITNGFSHIFIKEGNKSKCITNTFIKASKTITNFVSDRCKTILNSGEIVDAPVELFDTRKHSAEILFAFEPINGCETYTVISINAAHQNVVRFQNVTLSDKVMFSGAGETAVLAVIPSDVDSVVVNTPHFSKYSLIILSNIIRLSSKEKVSDINIRNFEKI